MKSSLIASCAFFVSFIPLLLFGIVIWKLPALAVAQSLVSDDVKHDTPGQVIKQGQSIHIDVDLALVNVTVTDPYNRLVTGLDTSRHSPRRRQRCWSKLSAYECFLMTCSLA